jgi:uncharacterized protein (TIGR02246 family)
MGALLNMLIPCLAILPLALMVQAAPADEQAIQSVIDRFMDGWNRHDAAAFSTVFAEDADFTNVRGIGATGRTKIAEFHAPVFETTFKNSHQQYTGIKIRFLRPDIAAVDVAWEMVNPDRKGILNFVMTKTAPTWQIVVMHNLDLTAAPTAR